MGTIPTVPTFTAGAVLTATDLNALGTAINFWAAPPRVLVYRSTSQTVSSTAAAWTLVSFDSELYDTDGIHSTTTNTSRLVCQTAGYYAVTACVTYDPNSTGSRAVMIRVNAAGSGSGGTPYVDITFDAPTAGQGMAFTPTQIIPLAVNDYVEVFTWQNSGGNLTTASGWYNTFAQMQLVGKV